MSIRFMPLLWRHSILSCSNDDSITQMEISENQFVGEWCLVAFRSFQETEIVIDGEKFFTIDQSKGSDFITSFFL